MKNVGKWLALILILVLIYLGWRWWSGSDTEAREQRDGDPSLLTDRVWIDQIPRSYTDYAQFLVVIADQPIGVFQKASNYRAEVELFLYRREGNKINLRFPQTETNKTFSYKITHCDEMPPFDLCLDLDSNPWGGPRRYYSDTQHNGDRARALVDRATAAANVR